MGTGGGGLLFLTATGLLFLTSAITSATYLQFTLVQRELRKRVKIYVNMLRKRDY